MKKLKFLDFAVFFLSLVIIGIFSYYAYGSSGSQSMVEIKTARGEWIYPIDQDGTHEFEGPSGKTVVQIKDSSARVIYSDCPEQICVSSGAISRPGSWIACLPNRVFIRIEGKDKENIDAGTF